MTFPGDGQSRNERAGRGDTSRRSAYQDESRRNARERELKRRSATAGASRTADTPGSTYRPGRKEGGAHKRRVNAVTAIALCLAALLVFRLGWVQLVWGPDLAVYASDQRTRVYTDPARVVRSSTVMAISWPTPCRRAP